MCFPSYGLIGGLLCACVRATDRRALAPTAQRKQVFSVQHFFLSALHLPNIPAIVTVCVQQYERFRYNQRRYNDLLYVTSNFAGT